MRQTYAHLCFPGLLLLVSFLFIGCGRTTSPLVETPPPTVTVSRPVQRKIVNSDEYTGRTEAVAMAEVRARVSGFLDKVNLKDGADVKKGDVLFVIDPRPYQADLEKAQAQLAQSEAQVERANREFDRAQRLRSTGATSQEELEKLAADRGVTRAGVEAGRAAVARAKLDLDFAKVVAPISGRTSRAYVTEGNLVTAGGAGGGGTLLTTIVTIDPMYAYYDVDERSVLHYRKMIREGKLTSARETKVPAYLGLTNETGFPHEGSIDFIDNRVDPATGTLRVRGVFANDQLVLSPGLFARIQVPIGAPHLALLITERALGADLEGRHVLVVNAENVVERRAVKMGALQDGMCVIEEGIKPNDWIVINGLQRARPGDKVAPQRVDAALGAGQRQPASPLPPARELNQSKGT